MLHLQCICKSMAVSIFSVSHSHPRALCSLSLSRLSFSHPSDSLNLYGSAMFKSKSTVSPITSHSVLAHQAVVGEDLPDDYGDWLPQIHPDHRRRAGILLHPTSFRGPYGIGDLGDQAFRFIDWLHDTGCSVWQVRSSFAPSDRKSSK